MSSFRKKPVQIEAVLTSDVVRWAAEDWSALPSWIVEAYEGLNPTGCTLVFTSKGVHITTLEGTMVADLPDMIIRGVKGELYPCKPDIFDATYDEVVG